MNRIPIRRSNTETLIRLSEFELLKHLKKVIKVSINDPIKLTLINEGLVTGIIKKVEKEFIEIEIDPNEIKAPEPTNSVLIIGSSRPLTCKKIFEHGTTLGIGQFIFFQAQLSEKSYYESKIYEESEYTKHLILGLAQSGIYSNLPKVSIYQSFDQIPLDQIEISNKLLLSLESHSTLDQVGFSPKISSTILVGPERGFTQDEEDIFEHMGFKKVSIGRSIQRVEYAVASALGQIELMKAIKSN